MENKLAPLYRQKVLKIILTARQNIKISAITDDTETFCNCNGVSTDTKQTTSQTLLKKSTSTKNYYICLCKPFLNLHEKQTRTALPTKSVEIILTARQKIEKYLKLRTKRKLLATETAFRQTQNRQRHRTLLKRSTVAVLFKFAT